MTEESANPEGPSSDTLPVRCRPEKSDDPIVEMIEVFHSLGIMVARGPILHLDGFVDPAESPALAMEIGDATPGSHSCRVSASERIVDALASEAP
jgi:hypothetical protein